MGLDMFLYKSKVIEQVCYWRKSNQIHAWFVNNVQEGQDDCRPYEVSKENIEELLNLCKQVNKGNARELLPTQQCFFFGSYEYDNDYFDDIKFTIQELERVLKETDWETETVYYQSSW